MIPPPPAEPPRWLRSAVGRRLAVVGAGGFIGSRVVALALAAGAEVSAILTGDGWRLCAVRRSGRMRVRSVAGGRWWEPGRIGDLRGHDALILLAYTPPPHGSDADEHERAVNVAGTEAVAGAAREAGAAVVFSSSADVYGPTHDVRVTEEAPTIPMTPYAAAKLEAERVAGGIALRIATVYGPGENGPRAIPSFIRALRSGEPAVLHHGGGDIRDYVHVDDVAAALVNAALAPTAPSVINVGSGRGRTTREVLATVAGALAMKAVAVERETDRQPSGIVLDPTLAAKVLAFEARTDFEAEVAAEAAWLTQFLSESTCR